MRNNPTMIADFSKLAPRHHKKFDTRFTSLPGADEAPINAQTDLFPSQATGAQDTFERAPSAKAKTDASCAPAVVAKLQKPAKASCCVVS